MTEGILLVSWGKRGYAYSAYNLALSIKHYSDLPIHLFTTERLLKQIPSEPFDKIELIEEPEDPGRFKVSLYDRMPFDHTLFLDVDALCLRDIRPTLEAFKSSDKPYRCFVYGRYDKDSPNEMPLMVWAYKDDIWNHYGFDDHVLPATQSSLQYIRKGEFCENLFKKVQENFDNPIPLEKLRNKWGGTQPDELYLNITLAQLGYDPQCENVIFFGNVDDGNYHEIKERFDFLSIFGGRGMIKNKYLRGYDGDVTRLGSKFKQAHIIPDKHANSKHKSTRNQGIMNPTDGKITVYTSYYKDTPERQKEIDYCMDQNLNNPLVDKVVILGEQYDHPKAVNIPHDRPTYADFFKIANQIGSEYSVLLNSDIYLDSTISKLFGVGFHNTFLAISRHDIKGGRRILFDASGWGRRGWSQDAWIWKGENKIKGGDYYLGLPGCDNKIAYEAKESGYRLNNPARDIKIYHVHETNVRNYNEADRLAEPYEPVPIKRLREVTKGRLLINQPGKTGDILLCLPIAKELSYNYHVEWLCPNQYHSMFKYVNYCRPISKHIGKFDKILDLSFGLKQGRVERWWQKEKTRFNSFVEAKYELAEIDINKRWELDYTRDEKRERELFNKVVTQDDYTLVHSNSDYGTPINVLADRVVNFAPVGDYTIFDWRKVVENAKAIHCIDSSLCNFVDVVDTKAELHYYKTDRVPNKWDETILRKKWNIVTS